MTPTKTPTPYLALTTIALMIVLSPLATAQDSGGEDLAIATPDFNKSKVLQEAALVQPLPHRTLQRLLPKSLAGLQQSRIEGRIDWVGPAGMTRVEAFYGDDEGGVKILVLDPAGMPPGGREYLAKVPVGETRAVPRGEQRGVRIGDFDATTETLAEGAFARVQAHAGPRVRVSAESFNGLSIEELVALLEEIDLGAFAALAPDAPPDLSERREPSK